jgi:hypothetical protein
MTFLSKLRAALTLRSSRTASPPVNLGVKPITESRMSKATIIVAVDYPSEVAAFETWFSRWKDKLAFISENYGCGCCVDIWEVEGPSEALSEIPPQCYAGSEWTLST